MGLRELFVAVVILALAWAFLPFWLALLITLVLILVGASTQSTHRRV